MTMYDPKAEMLLELARLAPEPSAVARARNLAALRARLAVPMPPTAGTPHPAPAIPAPATPAPATLAPATPAPATPSLPAAPRVAPAPAAPLVPNAPLAALPRGESSLVAVSASLRQLAGVGIITGAIGFFVGLSLNRAVLGESAQSVAPLTAAATAAPATAAPATPAPETREPASAALALGALSVPRAPADATLLEAPTDAALPAARVETAPVTSRPARALAGQRRGKPRDSSAPPGEVRAPSFFEAVQLLRRARNALQKGEAALALSLLDELDARFSPEVLDEERGATRVLGLCASGASEAARQLAARLKVRYPRSIYAHRLEQSCAGSAAHRFE